MTDAVWPRAILVVEAADVVAIGLSRLAADAGLDVIANRRAASFNIDDLSDNVSLLIVAGPPEGALPLARTVRSHGDVPIALLLVDINPDVVMRATDLGSVSVTALQHPAPQLIAFIKSAKESVVLDVMPRLLPVAEPPRPCGLTDQDVDTLGMIAAGMSNIEMATARFISERAIRDRVLRLYRHMGVNDRLAAVRHGVRLRLVETRGGDLVLTSPATRRADRGRA